MTNSATPRIKRPWIRIIAVSFFVIVSVVGIYLYNNYNRLISDALMKSFNSSIVSDVYELKFEKLRVDLFEGSIRVFDVVLQPREKPLKEYPYINSSFRLTTDKLTLMNVDLRTLLQYNRLRLERISITKPGIELIINSLKPVFIPFKDSSTTAPPGVPKKKAIESFSLHEFQLIDAFVVVTNSAKERQFKIVDFDISLENLQINQRTGQDNVSLRHVGVSVGSFGGSLQKGGVRRVKFSDFKIGIDSLTIRKTVDTLTFRFDDFAMGLDSLDIHTADSLYHFAMQSFDLSYKDKSIKLGKLLFKSNISDEAMQKRFKYQHTEVSGAVRSITINEVNFDSLIYRRGLIVGEVTLDSADVAIFKDNTKPVDLNRFPKYFGQQIRAIPMPLLIKKIKVTHVNLVNVERKKDSAYAKVNIRRGTVEAKNMTNRSSQPFTLHADAYLEDKVHFDVTLNFNYLKPQFTMEGKLVNFDLPDLNPVIQAYTPAKINKGIADEISFSGTVSWTNSTGTMTFLYHDLQVDLELHQKAKWKSSVIAFAANTLMNSSNPGSTSLPPRVVKFHAERDMNKGFVNIILKSVLNGLKETMIMSKENKKAYKQAKKDMKKQKK